MSAPQSPTDAAVLAALGERIARRRLEQDLTQAQLAAEAGISARTLIRLEGGESTQLTSLVRVLRVLGLLGDLDRLAPDPEPSPLERMRADRRRPKRASGRSGGAPGGEWTWGDEP